MVLPHAVKRGLQWAMFRMGVQGDWPPGRAAIEAAHGRRPPSPCSTTGSPRRRPASRTIPKRWRSRPPTRDGRPSVRMVLLKGHDARGFVFYTNSRQPQGRGARRQSARRPALPLEVAAPPGPHRRAGRRRSADAEADAYFASRAREFAARRLGVGPVAPARSAARRSSAASTRCGARFEGKDVPRPPHWGGYRVAPERIEFWTDRAAPPARAAAVHPRRRGLDRRPALPMSDGQDRRRAARRADHARRAGQRRARRSFLLVAQEPMRPGRPDRWRCSARSPTPGST